MAQRVPVLPVRVMASRSAARMRSANVRWLSCISLSTGAARQARCSMVSSSVALMAAPDRSTHSAPIDAPAATSGTLAALPPRPSTSRLWARVMRGCDCTRVSGNITLADWSSASARARLKRLISGLFSATGRPVETACTRSSPFTRRPSDTRSNSKRVAISRTHAAPASLSVLCDNSAACRSSAECAALDASARRDRSVSTGCRAVGASIAMVVGWFRVRVDPPKKSRAARRHLVRLVCPECAMATRAKGVGDAGQNGPFSRRVRERWGSGFHLQTNHAAALRASTDPAHPLKP